ncbi:MAG: hypothetical protein MJZ35_09215 [Bacteroidaceae bacterium]|nr:hypothetical protein [Bacteroidaceae bacterium]
MFVRKKPNKSGKVSVQVVLKSKSRKQQVVKTIGCSDDAEEIERLVAEGRKYIEQHCDSPMLPGSVAQASGGGGTTSDMPWREKDEDYLHWAWRAMQYAHAKHYPGNKLRKSKGY